MTQVKSSSSDIGRKGIHPSQPVLNLNMYHLHFPHIMILLPSRYILNVQLTLFIFYRQHSFIYRSFKYFCSLTIDLPSCNCTLPTSPFFFRVTCDNFCHQPLISYRIIPHQHYITNLKISFWAIPILTRL